VYIWIENIILCPTESMPLCPLMPYCLLPYCDLEIATGNLAIFYALLPYIKIVRYTDTDREGYTHSKNINI